MHNLSALSWKGSLAGDSSKGKFSYTSQNRIAEPILNIPNPPSPVQYKRPQTFPTYEPRKLEIAQLRPDGSNLYDRTPASN